MSAALSIPFGPPRDRMASGIIAVQAIVCRHFDVTPKDMISRRRVKYICRARHIAIWLAIRHTRKSSVVIGRHFNRDHTTILHAIGRIEQMLLTDIVVQGHIAALQMQINEG